MTVSRSSRRPGPSRGPGGELASGPARQASGCLTVTLAGSEPRPVARGPCGPRLPLLCGRAGGQPERAGRGRRGISGPNWNAAVTERLRPGGQLLAAECQCQCQPATGPQVTRVVSEPEPQARTRSLGVPAGAPACSLSLTVTQKMATPAARAGAAAIMMVDGNDENVIHSLKRWPGGPANPNRDNTDQPASRVTGKDPNFFCLKVKAAVDG